MAVSTCCTLPLWHLEDVHHGLRADSLQAIEPHRSAHAFQPQTPRVYRLRGFGLGGSQFR
jgi:hypothetical protein